ncbi:MAG: Asp-tRNA(Asn)/Glu-tRNA(Gln) amidotransferase subunit GatC [Myxococcales bacterium]
MVFDRARVRHIAKLASLSLSDAEADRFTSELAAIVGYVEELNTLDTTDVPPTADVQLGLAQWRSDTLEAGLLRDEVLAQAPEVEHDGFAVPTFVET